MTVEYTQLKSQPYALEECKHCAEPFPEFLRGMVQSTWRRWLGLAYCAVICHKCKLITGWEKP